MENFISLSIEKCMLIVIPAVSLPKIFIRLRRSERCSNKHYNQQRSVKTFLQEINLYPMHYPGMFVFQIHKSFYCQSRLFIPLDFLLNSSRQLFQVLFTLLKKLRPPCLFTGDLHLWGHCLSFPLHCLNFVCIIIHPLFFLLILSTYFQRSHILSLFLWLTFSGVLNFTNNSLPPLLLTVISLFLASSSSYSLLVLSFSSLKMYPNVLTAKTYTMTKLP